MPLPDPAVEPTLDVERAGALVGLGRSKAYTEARRFIDTGEGLPAIAFGRTLRVPTARLLELLGLDAHANGNGNRDEGPTPTSAPVNNDTGACPPNARIAE